MTDTAARLYAIDLLNRAGVYPTPGTIADVVAILPLIETDVVDAIEKPIGNGTSGTQAIVAARIASGCHRPNPNPPVTPQSTQPGQPAAASDVHSGAAALQENSRG